MPGDADFAIGAWTSPPCDDADDSGVGAAVTWPECVKEGATPSSDGRNHAKSPKVHGQNCPIDGIDGHDAKTRALYAAMCGVGKNRLQDDKKVGATSEGQAEGSSIACGWRREDDEPWTPYRDLSRQKMMHHRLEKQGEQAKDEVEDAKTKI